MKESVVIRSTDSALLQLQSGDILEMQMYRDLFCKCAYSITWTVRFNHTMYSRVTMKNNGTRCTYPEAEATPSLFYTRKKKAS